MGETLPKAAPRRFLKLPESTWRRFVRLWQQWLLPALLALAVSAATSMLMPLGFSFQPLPHWGPEAVGTPFRGAVPLKATRDLRVVDGARTQAERERVRDMELRVVDYNPSTQHSVQYNIQQGFREMRTALHERHAKEASLPQGTKAAQQAWLQAAKAVFLRHFSAMESEDFAALLADAFSESSEGAALSLVEVAYKSRLLPSREEMLRENATHVRMRHVGDLGEEVWRLAPPGVMDLREAHMELERFASVPGHWLPETRPLLKRAILRLAQQALQANLSFNPTETKARRDAAYASAAPVWEFFRKGQKIIGDGEAITPHHLEVLASLKHPENQAATLGRHVGGFATVLLFLFAGFVFFRTSLARFKPSSKDLCFLAATLLGMLVALFLWRVISEALSERHPQLPSQVLQALFPLATGAALVRFVLSEETALFFAISFAVIVGILLGDSLSFALASLAVACMASATIARAQDRKGILKAGLLSGALAFFVMLFWALAEGKSIWEGLATGLVAMLGLGFGLPALVMALTPIVESVFGYASDLKLLELANLNHPALKELIVRAPGTYHHSIVMGSLVESAAQAISANPLLARSCAYYHDIGKGKNPGYFAENQKGDNPHDALSPEESAAILKQHVADGLELARRHKLPKRVLESIPQHHGTRRMAYFFHKATTEADEGARIEESVFRYAGPKPQFREAALVMLADATEAAARALPSPTPEELKNLVLNTVNLIFSEGQLDECELTLRDLKQVVDAFVGALSGIYHARPSYPSGAFKTGKPETDANLLGHPHVSNASHVSR